MKVNAKIGVQFHVLQEHLQACEQAIDIIGSEDYESLKELNQMANAIHAYLYEAEMYAIDETYCVQLIEEIANLGWELELNLFDKDYQYWLYPADGPECKLTGVASGTPDKEGITAIVREACKLTSYDLARDYCDSTTCLPVKNIPDEVIEGAKGLYAELPELLKWLDR